MYTRNFGNIRNGESKSEIPVQMFADSFSTDAFMKDKEKIEEKTERITETIQETKQDIKRKSDEKTKIELDDLLLVGLLILFLTDKDNKDNLLLTIILASVLLF